MDETTRTDAPPGPAKRGSRWRVAVLVGLVLIVLAMSIGTGVAWWAVRSEGGSAWLGGFAPGLKVIGPKGSLIGDFSAERIEIELPGSAGILRIDAPRWRGLTAERGSGGRWLRIAVDELHADRVTLLPPATPKPASSEPAAPPASLRLPIEIEIRAASVDEFGVGSADARSIRALHAAVHLGADGGAVHTVDKASAAWDRILGTGAARIAADPPFAVAGTLEFAGQPAWQAKASIAGPLDALRAEATLRAQPSPTHPAQALDARVVLHPFAAWPVGELEAHTQALDLSAFANALPATSLTGRAIATTTGSSQPATVSIDIENARPGRWNDGLLPLRRLRGELSARPDDPRIFELSALDAELGAADRSAGRLTGRGHWSPKRWTLDATLAQIAPAALDARAPEMRLDGTATLAGTGFTSPSSAERRVEARARIQGLGAGKAGPRIGLSLDASLRAIGGELGLEIRRAEATAGRARATLTGSVARAKAEAPWQVRGTLALADFDPASWWPGGANSAWQKGPHRLNARGSFDIAVPATLAGRGIADTMAAMRGSAELSLTDSVLAGVPLQGQASFRNSTGRAEPGFDIVAAGNRLRGSGHVGTGTGERDEWQLGIDAPQIARLAPLLRIVRGAASTSSTPQAGAGAALGGVLAASAHVTGRWPDISSEGQLDAGNVRVESFALRKASGHWRLGSRPGAALEGALSVDRASFAGASIERIEAGLEGTARAHRLTVRAESKALPPEWADAVQAAGTPALTAAGVPAVASPVVAAAISAPAAGASAARSVFTLDAEGGLVEEGADRAAGWRGVVHQLDVAGVAAPARSWLRASEVRAAVIWGGGPLRIDVDPGRAEALGAALRWSRIAWRSAETGAAGARLDVQADVDPVAVAPILARLQPDFGWGGDLKVGLHIDVRSAPAVSADVLLDRRSGDLTVTDEYGTQSLGLSDLRIGLVAKDGVWRFTQALAGNALGAAAGTLVARTSGNATWPGAETPIEGTFELQVANLGTWGTWVPAGWRLGGSLHANASIGGRFGAPEYTGHVEGSALSARNFVQGVNVSEGDAAIALQGTTARIEHFTARAGGGTMTLEGTAALGDAPVAQLKLTAEKFQLLGRVDRRIVASGSASLKLDRETIGLDGTFKVDDGLIDFTRSDAPALADDVEVVRRKPAGGAATSTAAATTSANAGAAAAGSNAAPAAPDAAASAPASPASRKVALDLRVGLGEKLRVRGRGLDAGLRGELHITSPGGRLAVNGTVSAVDGTYAAYGQKLAIDRGLLGFTGAVENPRLDIEATRPNLDVRVGVSVTGTALLPRVRLFSEPDLSDMDKLSWLVLGRGSEGVGRADTALLQRAALALLSGEGPGVTDRITHAIGLDEISVRQQSEGDVKETFVSLGKQISKRWYVGYERGLNATTGSWQLVYRLARRLTVRAQAGGDNSLDLIWTLRWK